MTEASEPKSVGLAANSSAEYGAAKAETAHGRRLIPVSSKISNLIRDPALRAIRMQPEGSGLALGRFFDHFRDFGPGSALVRAEDLGHAAHASGFQSAQLNDAGGETGVDAAARRREGGGLPAPKPLSAAPARSIWKTLGRAGLWSVFFLALDWGVKFLFVSAGFPFVYHFLDAGRLLIIRFAIPMSLVTAGYYVLLAHARKAPLQGLRRFREKYPLLGRIVYGALYVLTFPAGIGERRYAGDLAQKYPVVAKLMNVVDVAAAAIFAAVLGNGLEALAWGKVVDFIPFGHGRMNFADSFIFFGLPLLWMVLDFFKAVRKSDEENRPVVFKSWRYYLLPLLGSIAFIYMTHNGYDRIPMPAWYFQLFSLLFWIGTFAADVVMQRFVAAFNRPFRREGPEPPKAPSRFQSAGQYVVSSVRSLLGK